MIGKFYLWCYDLIMDYVVFIIVKLLFEIDYFVDMCFKIISV